MAFDIRKLQRLKQALLIVSILYFYGMAIALSFGFETYGLDRPFVFVAVGSLFILAIAMEAGMTWWHRRKRIAWGVLLTMTYALLGFIVAPKLYGDWVLTAALFLPVLAVFVVGFAFSYSRILVRAFTPNMRLSIDQVTTALRNLPGWEFAVSRLEKTYRFAIYGESLEFVNAVGVIAQKMHHIPEVDLRKNSVKIRLSSPDVGGVSQRDIDIAKEFDKI